MPTYLMSRPERTGLNFTKLKQENEEKSKRYWPLEEWLWNEEEEDEDRGGRIGEPYSPEFKSVPEEYEG